MPVQAAELHLRRHLGETRIDAVGLLDRPDWADGLTTARFGVDGVAYAVTVHTTVDPEPRRR